MNADHTKCLSAFIGVHRRLIMIFSQLLTVEALDEFGEALGDLVANAAELGEAVRLVAGGGSGIFKAPVNPAGPRGEHGAALVGVVAHGDHIVEGLSGEVIDVLGPMGADIDAEFRQHGDGFGPHSAGVGPGGVYLHAVASHVAKQALGHLAAGRVAGEEDEDSVFHPTASVKTPPNHWRLIQRATFTSEISTGTSTSGPMTAAKAAPWWIPKVAIATAMASSKLLDDAVKESVVASA